jgi:hypothetical protein
MNREEQRVMASSPTTGGNPEGFAALRQTFETAVNEIGTSEPNRAKQPIYQRKRAGTSNSGAQDPNRALKDAADALAALWKTAGGRSHLGRSGRK